MNSTADIPKLDLNSVSDIYKEASSLNYLSGDDTAEKLTIFSELKKQPQRYWIVKQINKGGVKRILNVRDNSTGRNVAMAVLQDSQNIHHVENFLREARITALLQHPNIMPVFDIGLNSLDQPYFTMKLVEHGNSLDNIIQNHKIKINRTNFELNDLLELFVKICDAVAYAHSKGIIHLDLKPANIQIDDFGELLVCDWGLARFSTDPSREMTDKKMTNVTSLDFINLTLNGVIKGTPGYMAPEQATLEKTTKDHRTDIYSLGAILYTLLSFNIPIKKGKLKDMLANTVTGRKIPLYKFKKSYNISDALIKIANKAMHISPDKRYQQVEEMRRDIRAYLNGFTTSVEESNFMKELFLSYKRHKSLWNIIILSGIIIVSTTSIFLFEIRKREIHSIGIAQKATDSEKKLQTSLEQLEREKVEKFKLKKISAVVVMNKAIELYNQTEYKQATDQLMAAVVNNPELSDAWYYLGRDTLLKQNFIQSAVYFQKAIDNSKDQAKRIELQEIIGICHKYEELKQGAEKLSNPEKENFLKELKPELQNELLIRSYFNYGFDGENIR